MEVTMFPMGFGESILLHQGDSCLLVDCGSESGRRKGCFNAVKDKLEQFNKKSLLITHFHSDHINGIKYLGDKFLADFEHIYLPHIFTLEDKTLELLIAEYLLEAFLDRRRKSSQIWGCLIPVAKTHLPIVLVSQGTQFEEADYSFRALWPIPHSPEPTNLWQNVKETLQYLQLPYDKIEKLACDTKDVVLWLIGYNDLQSKHTNAEKELQDILKEFHNLCDNYITSMQGSGGVAIRKECIWKSYQDIKNKNETSIVFRTADDCERQILMTGDVTRATMKEIVERDVAIVLPQRKRYDVVKAPHHGTQSCYFDFSQYYDVDALYISNGETTWSEIRRGKISGDYFLRAQAKEIRCSNTPQYRCEFAYDNGLCAACCEECMINDC